MNTQFLFAGRAILTVESSKTSQEQHGHRSHYTYKIERGNRESNKHLYFVSFMTGTENTDAKSYRYLAMLDKDGNVRFTVGSRFLPTSQVARVFKRAVAAVFIGRDGLEQVEATGWKIHHAGCCGRCGKLLTNPVSIETGIGPECEFYVKLGIDPQDVPCVDDRGPEVARLQYAYWMYGDDGVILYALADAAEEAFGWDRARAELYAQATRRLMRKHKKGVKLSEAFRRNMQRIG